MYGSLLLLVCCALENLGASDNTKQGKAPNIRQIEQEIGDLSGFYSCKGQDADGKTYSGIVSLTKKKDVYVIQWVIGVGNAYSGIGIRQGNTLAGGWALASERGIMRGVNLYRIESSSAGPRLVGRWASIPGAGVQQTETLRFLRKHEPDDD